MPLDDVVPTEAIPDGIPRSNERRSEWGQPDASKVKTATMFQMPGISPKWRCVWVATRPSPWFLASDACDFGRATRFYLCPLDLSTQGYSSHWPSSSCTRLILLFVDMVPMDIARVRNTRTRARAIPCEGMRICRMMWYPIHYSTALHPTVILAILFVVLFCTFDVLSVRRWVDLWRYIFDIIASLDGRHLPPLPTVDHQARSGVRGRIFRWTYL